MDAKLILNPLVTLLVGGFAIGLYHKQKVETKTDAAKLILQEIRYAEQQIRVFRDSRSYPLSTRLLPTNNWHNKVNLFIKDLSESEIDLISKFYSTAAYIDTLIKKISDQKNNAVMTIVPGRPHSPAPGEQPSPQAIPIEPQLIEFNTQLLLQEISNTIEFVYNTPAIDKLRSEAKKKPFLLF